MTQQGSGGFADVKSNRDKEKREMQVYRLYFTVIVIHSMDGKNGFKSFDC